MTVVLIYSPACQVGNLHSDPMNQLFMIDLMLMQWLLMLKSHHTDLKLHSVNGTEVKRP